MCFQYYLACLFFLHSLITKQVSNSTDVTTERNRQQIDTEKGSLENLKNAIKAYYPFIQDAILLNYSHFYKGDPIPQPTSATKTPEALLPTNAYKRNRSNSFNSKKTVNKICLSETVERRKTRRLSFDKKMSIGSAHIRYKKRLNYIMARQDEKNYN